MPLAMHQKSVYLIILNATMILRSIGKSLSLNANINLTLRDFKINLFNELENLTDLMESNQLTENHILDSVRVLSNQYQISFGQAQKAINVILKYHFYLSENISEETKSQLFCPIDSINLRLLNRGGIPLTRIDEAEFLTIQREIQQQSATRIDFDIQWDEQHLGDDGLL